MSLRILNSHALKLAGVFEEAFSDDIMEASSHVTYWRKVNVESHGKLFTLRVYTEFHAAQGMSMLGKVTIDVIHTAFFEQIEEYYTLRNHDKVGELLYSRTKRELNQRGNTAKVDAYSLATSTALANWVNTYVQDFVDTAIDLLLKEGLIREKQSKRSRA